MSNEATGSSTVFGWVKNPNAWLLGAAAAAGSGQQLEFEQETLTPDSQLIENMGINGSASQLPGGKGNETHSGNIGPLPFYFRGPERMIAQPMGSANGGGAPVQQGGDLAYKHILEIADSARGIYGTAVFKGNGPAIREYPHVKLTGFDMEFTDGQYGKITFPAIPSRLNLNVGAAIVDRIVASVEPANGVLTIANQPAEPSPLSITIVDANASITEYVVTIKAKDVEDNVITLVYRKSVNGLVYTFTEYVKEVISATGSELAGTATGDTLRIGVTNGVNNATQTALLSLPSTTELDLILFPQLELLVNDQSGGALTTAHEFFISRFMLKLERGQEGKVTTKGGNKPDEPGATAFVNVTGGFNFPDWNTENHPLLKDYLFNKAKKKMKFSAVGPIVNGSTAASLVAFLNNCQYSKAGGFNVSGPGRQAFDVEFKAHRALAAPAGWSYTKPLTLEIVNGNSANALA